MLRVTSDSNRRAPPDGRSAAEPVATSAPTPPTARPPPVVSASAAARSCHLDREEPARVRDESRADLHRDHREGFQLRLRSRGHEAACGSRKGLQDRDEPRRSREGHRERLEAVAESRTSVSSAASRRPREKTGASSATPSAPERRPARTSLSSASSTCGSNTRSTSTRFMPIRRQLRGSGPY